MSDIGNFHSHSCFILAPTPASAPDFVRKWKLVLRNVQLISHGASVVSQSARALIPLHRAAGQGHLEILQELRRAGSPMDSKTVDGWTPLHGACNSGHAEAAEFLIANQAEVNWQSNDGRAPLHRACRRSHYQMVQTLLNHEADVLCTDNEDDIPLHRATKAGCVDICELLLRQHEASAPMQLKALNNCNRTPREEAIYQGYRHVADTLQEYELQHDINSAGEINSLEMAIRDHDLPRLETLLGEGAHVGSGLLENSTLLHTAMLFDDEPIARFLINLPTTNLKCRTVDGWEPLHCAANGSNIALIKLCLEHGASVSSQTHDGQASLHKACRAGNLEAVKLLLEAGAPIDVEDKWGWTPLHTASAAGAQHVVEVLLDRGADMQARDKYFKTPHVCASEAGHHALCQYYRQRRRPEWDFHKAAPFQ